MDCRSTRTVTFPTYSITPACNCSRVRGCSEVISLYSADLIYPIDGRKKKLKGDTVAFASRSADLTPKPKSGRSQPARELWVILWMIDTIVTRAGSRRWRRTNAGEEEGAFFRQTTKRNRRPAIVLTKDSCYLDFVTMLATACASHDLVVKTSSSLRASVVVQLFA